MIPQNTGEEVGDVEGYAVLIDLFGAGFAGLTGLIFYMGGVILTPYSGLVIAISVIARLMWQTATGFETKADEIRAEVARLTAKYPLYE